MIEPIPTAIALTVAGLLITLCVVFSRFSGRLGVPAALLFLVLGMAAGSQGPGGIAFSDYGFAFRLGTVALVLILFDGGLNTPYAAIRTGLKPALVLASLGVVGTAGIVAVGAHLMGFGWTEALLLGAVVSSTDAATVFSVLRGSGVQLRRRVGVTLELESGLNDPVAVILTVTVTSALVGDAHTVGSIALEVFLQIVVGLGAGAAIGLLGRQLLRRLKLAVAGLYPLLTLALAMLAFGLPTVFHGSGFLAVYVAAVLIGNGPLPYKASLLHVHDAFAWFAQVAMFLVLGLLVFPSRLLEVVGEGLLLGFVLGVVARPLVVWVCLLPFKYPRKEVLYLGWVGLRGAVPIILATFPVLQHAPGAERIFHVVFFVVVVNAAIHGGTVRWLTRRLGLEDEGPPPPTAVVEINARTMLDGELLAFHIHDALLVAGATLAEIPFPPGAAVMLIVRDHTMIAPKGSTQLLPGDHVSVFCAEADIPVVQLMFGQAGS